MGENRRTWPTASSINAVSPINDKEPHHLLVTALCLFSVLPKEENRRDARRERVKPSCSVYSGVGVTQKKSPIFMTGLNQSWITLLLLFLL